MPKRGVVRSDKQGNLSPRYIRPFEVLERVGSIAYQLALPPSVSSIHAVFHVSMLGSTPHIRLIWWIRESLLLMQMGPSKRDQCVSWIVRIRF